MPSYTLGELIEKMEPQARIDKALIARCVDGIGLYAAQIAAQDRNSSKIEKMRDLAEQLIVYWGLDDNTFTENAKSMDEYLRSFDNRVYDARTGGAVTGDVFQTASNVIYGLYRYGTDMVVSQGADAMSDILDISGLIEEIGKTWDYEPDIVDDLAARLEEEVREMLDNIALPGHPVSGVTNAGYEIQQAVMFENGLGITLAHNPNAPAPYVTWRYGEDNDSGNWFVWGHYFATEERAKIDFIKRVDKYMEQYGVKEKLPTAAAVGDEKKPSVMEQIKAAQKAPKPPVASKPEQDKKKAIPEL